MRNLSIAALLCTFAACGTTAPTTTEAEAAQASTGCVSDPIVAGGGDDIVPHCRPTTTQLQQAASIYATNHYPPTTPRADGGCGYAPSGHLVCILQLLFGGDDVYITCAEQDDGSIGCIVTDNGEIVD